MKYLAISKTPYRLAYASFENKVLTRCGSIILDEPNENKRLVVWYDLVEKLIEENKPEFLLTHLLNRKKVMKKDIEKIIEVRTILKLIAEKNNIFYAEFKTSGWELRITDLKPTCKRKLNFVNKTFDLNIIDIEIANAIILAEGVALKRLQIGE